MSATPRPWWIDDRDPFEAWIRGPESLGEKPENVAEANHSNAALIVRAVNAFDALLAVAKAADDDLIRDLAYDAPTNPALRSALAALDAAFPGWRSWR